MTNLTTRNRPAPAFNPPILPLGRVVQTAVIAAGHSKHTRRSYVTSIGQFCQYLSGELGISPPLAEPERDGRRTRWAFRQDSRVLGHISPSMLDGFRQWLAANGASANTQEVRIAAIVTFLSVCYRDGLLTDAHARRLGLRPYQARRTRDQKPTGRRLSPKEVRQLRAAIPTGTTKGKRDAAIVDLMLFAGLRRGEICGLSADSIRQENGRFWLTITGKGNKTRRIKIHDTLYKSISTWLTARDEATPPLPAVTGRAPRPLFEGITRHGRPTGRRVTGATIGRIVAEYGHAAGLSPAAGPNVLAPHDLRRTCARNAYDNGAPLPKIQQLLGHANVETTMRYIGHDDDDTDTATDYVRY